MRSSTSRHIRRIILESLLNRAASTSISSILCAIACAEMLEADRMKFGVNLVMDFFPLLFPGLKPLHSIRPTHDVTSSPHGTASRLRAHGFLESVLSNPHVKLRA